MAGNGRLAPSDLSPIPGGRLANKAAASWNRMRQKIGKDHGVWIAPTSPRTAYRTYAEQIYFWDLYKHGGNLAAYPGQSNHGWGLAVDVATPEMARLINEEGAEFGWQKHWSDAPSEWWHFKYDPGHDQHRGEQTPTHKHPYHVLTDREQQARDTLVKERRSAKRHGGWDKIDADHLTRARRAKRKLVSYMREIEDEAKKTGWNRVNRKRRFDYMQKLVQG